MKIKVGVFFGGKSVEHEISVISAIQAIMSMDIEKYNIIPIYITKGNEMYVGEEIGKIESYKNIDGLIARSQRVILVNENDKVNIIRYPQKMFKSPIYDYIDVAFPIVHGTNVEDGTLQGYLQMLDLPYVGCDVLSSAVGMDKAVMKAVLKEKGIPVLDCLVFEGFRYAKDSNKIIEKVEAAIPYPVIVKPVNLGSSIGISKAADREELEEALDLGFEFAEKVLVEPAIENLREINCSVVGDTEQAQASECEEPVSNDEILSYTDKYMSNGDPKTGNKVGDGAKGTSGMASLSRKIPAEISDERRSEVRRLAVKTFKALGCNGVSRIDFMIDTATDQLYVNEINTIPGSLSFYLWEPVGIEYKDLLSVLVELALKRKRKQGEIHYSFDTNVLSGVNLGGSKAGDKTGA